MINPRIAAIVRAFVGSGANRSDAALELYETSFASRFGGVDRAALAFEHGSTAFFALLHHFGVGPGHEVVLSAYTCHSVPRTIRAIGATPVFVDIDPANFGPSSKAILAALTERTKAVLVQHTYGWPADIDPVVAAAKPRGIVVIEDCCQTLGAKLGNRRVGAIGDAAFFSSQWNKPFSTGQGGMALITSDRAAALRQWRDQHSSPRGLLSRLILSAELLVYECVMFPRSAVMVTSLFRMLSRMLPLPGGSDTADLAAAKALLMLSARPTTAQARLGLLEVQRFEQQRDQRREMAARLQRAAANAGVVPPSLQALNTEDATVAPLRLPIRVADPLAAIATAREYGFEIVSWFDEPLDPLKEFAVARGYTPGSCPLAEDAARHIVLLPLGRRITPRVAARVEQFLSDHAVRLRG